MNEKDYVKKLLKEGEWIISAPRRWGKTTILNKILEEDDDVIIITPFLQFFGVENKFSNRVFSDHNLNKLRGVINENSKIILDEVFRNRVNYLNIHPFEVWAGIGTPRDNMSVPNYNGKVSVKNFKHLNVTGLAKHIFNEELKEILADE